MSLTVCTTSFRDSLNAKYFRKENSVSMMKHRNDSRTWIPPLRSNVGGVTGRTARQLGQTVSFATFKASLLDLHAIVHLLRPLPLFARILQEL